MTKWKVGKEKSFWRRSICYSFKPHFSIRQQNSNNKKRKGPPKCLNKKCDGYPLVKDCPKTSNEEKAALHKAFRAKKARKNEGASVLVSALIQPWTSAHDQGATETATTMKKMVKRLFFLQKFRDTHLPAVSAPGLTSSLSLTQFCAIITASLSSYILSTINPRRLKEWTDGFAEPGIGSGRSRFEHIGWKVSSENPATAYRSQQIYNCAQRSRLLSGERSR